VESKIKGNSLSFQLFVTVQDLDEVEKIKADEKKKIQKQRELE
jgi:hypothetical protein